VAVADTVAEVAVATVETAVVAMIAAVTVAAAGKHAASPDGKFAALNAPIHKHGRTLWLEDLVLLFKNVRRNSLGRIGKKRRLQSGWSAKSKAPMPVLATWMTISITVCNINRTLRCSKNSMLSI